MTYGHLRQPNRPFHASFPRHEIGCGAKWRGLHERIDHILEHLNEEKAEITL